MLSPCDPPVAVCSVAGRYRRRVDSVVARLPTALVTRYRAVDREHIWAPAHVVDTPSHLDALTEDIGRRGILVPLRLTFNREWGALDGNHRIAVALRLGLPDVPVTLVRLPEHPRPAHAKPMSPADLSVIEAVCGSTS